MPDKAIPHRPDDKAMGPGESPERQRQERAPQSPVDWPRDMNALGAAELPWGRDPEGLRDA